MRSALLRIRAETSKPAGINGWCSTFFTLACVFLIRVEGHITLGHLAEVYSISRHFADNLLAVGFLYCVGALIFAGGKDRLVPASGVIAALALAPKTLVLSLMFLPFLLTPKL